MSDHTEATGDEPATEPPTPHQRFESLARRLIAVPKDELRQAAERDREERQPA